MKEIETTEYIFILPDGSKRYEMVWQGSDVHDFRAMHGAVSAMPLRIFEEMRGDSNE